MFNTVITLKTGTAIIIAIVIAVLSAGSGYVLRGNNTQACIGVTVPLRNETPRYQHIPTNDGRGF